MIITLWFMFSFVLLFWTMGKIDDAHRLKKPIPIWAWWVLANFTVSFFIFFFMVVINK